jgi:glycerol-3-phosphate dehydrogenase
MHPRFSIQIGASAIAVMTLLAGGCSAHRQPVAAVAKAELAVTQADQTTAPQYAELELKLAREKLAEAKDHLQNKDYKEARWYADEALVDAQLAEVKAESAEARATATQTRESIETIRNEANRGVSVERRETIKTIEVR